MIQKQAHKILIVGSNLINLKVLESKLTSLGYSVVKATDGVMAIQMAKDLMVDMIILETQIKEMDGYKIGKTVKTNSDIKHIITVFVVDDEGSVSLEKAAQAGADEFIARPFDQVVLDLRLKSLFNAKIITDEFADLQVDLELKIAQRAVEAMEASDAGLYALAKLAESRDHETGEHLDRIRRYCVVLTHELSSMYEFDEQIEKGFIANIYRSSPLHDIGKVGIPDSILLKPGKLTVEEFEIMKTHTTIGATILKDAYTMMQNKPHFELAWIIALTHHEKYNGNGYPQGTKGKDIPLCGRIVALCDVYDALVSKRVYKDAMSHEKAKKIILGEPGKHFDPIIVKAFGNVEQQFLEVKRRYQ
ncbi:response regulator [PVC group bacterium]|nr:response regulator [PVC group bacterium]